MVYDTVDGENNQLEKTMEVAGIRIYHYGWNFFSKRMWYAVCGDGGWNENCFFFQYSDNIKSCVLVVDDTVNGKDN